MQSKTAGQLTRETEKIKMAIQSLRLVFLCLVAGLFVELVGNYIIYNYFDSYVVIQSLQSTTYALLCLFCFYGYKSTKNKLLLLLTLTAFIYGVLLIITINDTAYNYLRGIIWHNSFNYLLVYRCVEMFVLIKVIMNGRLVDWIRDTFVNTRSSDRIYINRDNSEVDC